MSAITRRPSALWKFDREIGDPVPSAEARNTGSTPLHSQTRRTLAALRANQSAAVRML